MLSKIDIHPSKTYANEANVDKAIEKVFGKTKSHLRYFVKTDETGRFFPVFVGEAAIQEGVHLYFNVIS